MLQTNFQGFSIKAFSLLEVIIAVLLIAIIFSFSFPRFFQMNKNSNLVKLKSDYILILNSLKKFQTKKLLLSENTDIQKLDNAKFNFDGEKLFSNILDISIISKNIVGNWIKNSDENYSFLLSKDEKVHFILENNRFKCINPSKFCEKLY